MQRMAPQAPPPRRQEGAGMERSPALMMANRIRMEQGPERAAQYLAAMEPYLAPGERTHIATSLGLPVMQPTPPQQNGMNSGSAPNMGGMGGLGNLGGPGGLGNLGGMMQMMQLLGGLQGGAQGGGQAGGNPMQLAQMLSGLMGGKK